MLNVRSLIDAVENGGMISYFYNSGADTLLDCGVAPSVDTQNRPGMDTAKPAS